jgi:hypothetical protein
MVIQRGNSLAVLVLKRKDITTSLPEMARRSQEEMGHRETGHDGVSTARGDRSLIESLYMRVDRFL